MSSPTQAGDSSTREFDGPHRVISPQDSVRDRCGLFCAQPTQSIAFVGYADLVPQSQSPEVGSPRGEVADATRPVAAAPHGEPVEFIPRNVAPGLLLTTTGRRSGLSRDTPLVYTTDDDAFVVVGSNYGRANHPDWSANLMAHPKAAVTIAGRRVDVVAELADRAQKERVWPLVLKVWPAYDTYAARSGRDLRVFILRPAAG